MTLRIGTRRSKLAIAQGEEVVKLLSAQGVQAELVPMSTSGDEGAEARMNPAGLKGLFVDAIVDALGAGEIDVAVHSAKDLPAEEEDDGVFSIAAVPTRADPFDVLVTRNGTLETGARVGTSSLRRRAQLMRARPGVKVIEIRGNVDTRLRKVEEGAVDGVVLAAAGLERLGTEPAHMERLGLSEMIPAPGQGCLAIQCRADDATTIEALAPLNHPPSRLALEAERSLMWRLGGGCSLPLGGLATIHDETIRLDAIVLTEDGSEAVRAGGEADTPDGVAAVTARALIEGGAEGILERLGA